ncbi:MAG: hypothetical protein ACK5HR_04655 [Mycoplasmatales bacterium]
MYNKIVKLNYVRASCLISSKLSIIIGIIIFLSTVIGKYFIKELVIIGFILLALAVVLSIVCVILGIVLTSLINKYVTTNKISVKQAPKVEWFFRTKTPWKLLKGVNSEKEFKESLENFYTNID